MTFGSGVTYIPAYLFATGASRSDGTYAHVTKVVVKNSATTTGTKAFYHCFDLKANITVDSSGNEDGVIDMNDVLRLAKYVSGMNVNIAEGSGDVNGDGVIDMNDVLRLAKYVSGMSVTIY